MAMLLGLTPVERVFGGRIHNTVFRFDWNRRSVMFRAGVWDVQDRVAEPLIRVLSCLRIQLLSLNISTTTLGGV